MIKVGEALYVGTEHDYETEVKCQQDWYVVHACKEPYHRQLLGYSGRGAPKEHPEYFYARRGNRLFLNLVDVENPDYIPQTIIDAALAFVDEAMTIGKKCLAHCNQGESRSPSIGLLYLASRNKIPNASLEDAEQAFLLLYPKYAPKQGMRGYLKLHWSDYVKTSDKN